MKSKLALALAVTFSLARLALAQETVPLEEAQKIAHKLAAAVGTISDAPLQIDADSDKPQLLKGGEIGLLVVPDRKLSADSLANAGTAITPVAQLWTHKATVAVGGKATSNDKLRILTVGEGEKQRDVQLFLLGAAKNDKGALELVVFGKGSEPIAHLPLSKAGSGSQELPLELSGRKDSEDSGTLTISALGGYKAEIAIVKAAE